MPEEEYELMPHRAVARIKRELELLKKNAGKQPSVKMKISIDKLNDNINSLRNLFQEAAKAMPEEGPDPHKLLLSRIDKLEEENKQIAQGIVVVADLVKELKGETKMPQRPMAAPMPKAGIPGPMPKPVFRQMPPKMHAPGMPEPPKMAPLPETPPGMAPLPEPPGMSGMPPMPPRESSLGPPPMPPPPKSDFAPMGKPIPPPMLPGAGMPGPMHELPPLPDLKTGPKKKGFFSKLFKK